MRVHQAHKQYIRWLLATRDLSPHTIRAYESDVAAFGRHLGMHALVNRIDHECLVAFVEQLQASGLSAMSIRRRASGLRGFCKWLLACRLLDEDPWNGVSLSAGRQLTLPRIVPAHELNRLFASLQMAAAVGDVVCSDETLTQPAASTTLLAVALMVATGVRVHEVVSIKREDIDLPSRSLRIMGKGRRERHVFLTNDWLTNLTHAYLNTGTALGLESGPLLFNLYCRPLTTQALRSRLRKAAVDAGLTTRVTPHMLRHTAATQLIEAGVDIRYIQRLLGHSSLTTTEIYTHVSNQALHRMVSQADVLKRLLW